MLLRIAVFSAAGSAAVLLGIWASLSCYYCLCFRRMRRRRLLKSHPHYALIEKGRCRAYPLRHRRYSKAPRDGNCGFYSVLAAAYPVLRAEATVRRGTGKAEGAYASDAAADILGAHPAFEEVSYTEAKVLVRWLRTVVGRHVVLHAEHYTEPLAGLGHTPESFARSVTAFWRPAWLDHLGLCALSGALRLRFVLLVLSSSTGTCYVNEIGRDSTFSTVRLLNTDNRHFEPVF